jgi:hypothetical protein
MRRTAGVTLAALGALVAATFVAPPAAASPDYIGVSHDGITWELTSLAVPLDTDLSFMVPGDTKSAYMYLRNNSDCPALAHLSFDWDHDFALNYMFDTALVNGSTTHSILLAPAEVAHIEVALTLPSDYTHAMMGEVVWVYISVIKECTIDDWYGTGPQIPTPPPRPGMPGAPDLPVTGFDVAIIFGGLALVAVGLLILIARRRGEPDEEPEREPNAGEQVETERKDQQ